MKANLPGNSIINTYAINNYSKLKLSLFFLPLFFLVAVVLFLYKHDALNTENYILIQKDCFLFINSKLSQFPNTIYNLTQLGDCLISFSLLTLFIICAPKIWESLLSASLVSCVFSTILKKLFAVPRPALAFDNSPFFIIGKTLCGNNSLPSGHSITIFTTFTVLLFSFMPKKLDYKILWIFFIITTAFSLALTRVGIGAHYPLDVFIGGIFGFISGLLGIFITRKYKIWDWISNKKYYPVFIVLFLICCISLIIRITHENLIIYYFSIASLVVSLYKITTVYVKK